MSLLSLGACALSAAALAGCGGGGSTAGDTSGATSFTVPAATVASGTTTAPSRFGGARHLIANCRRRHDERRSVLEGLSSGRQRHRTRHPRHYWTGFVPFG